MAYTLNCVGTSYFGVSDPDPEGWRSGTLCFGVFGLPILPLRRHVIRPRWHYDPPHLFEDTDLEVAETGSPRLFDVLGVFFVRWCILLPVAIGPLAYWIFKATSGEMKEHWFLREYGLLLAFAAIAWMLVCTMIVAEIEGKRLRGRPEDKSFGLGFWIYLIIVVVVLLVLGAICSRSGDHEGKAKKVPAAEVPDFVE